MTFIEKILDFFGLIPKWKYDELKDGIDTELKLRDSSYMSLREDYDNLCTEATELRNRLAVLDADRIEAIEKENEKLKTLMDKTNADIAEAEEYYKEVQKQISEVASQGEVYKFRYNLEFPGSTTIKDHISQNGDSVRVSGRTIFMDDITQRIQAETNLTKKYMIGLNTLMKMGAINKLTENLIKDGVLQITYGYTESTTMEIYYSIEAVVPNSKVLLLNKDEK